MSESGQKLRCPECGIRYKWLPVMASRKILCACGVKVRMPMDQTHEMHIFTLAGEITASEYSSTRTPVGANGAPGRPVTTRTSSGIAAAMGSGMGSVMGASGMGASGVDLNFEDQNNSGTMMARVAVKAKKARRQASSVSSPRVCPKCHAQVKANARVCNTCEADLGRPPQMAQSDSKSSSGTEVGKVKCPQCGIKYKWRAELARKKVLCLCKLKFRIPFQPTQEVIVVDEEGDIKATEFLAKRKKQKEMEAMEKAPAAEAEARADLSGNPSNRAKSGEVSEVELDVAYDPREENSKTIAAAVQPIDLKDTPQELTPEPVRLESNPVHETRTSVIPRSNEANTKPPSPNHSTSMALIVLSAGGVATGIASLVLFLQSSPWPAAVCLAGSIAAGATGLWLFILRTNPTVRTKPNVV